MAQCQEPYPDKYHKANEFYRAWPSSARQPRQDTLLLLFALSSQVEHGPCKDPKPSAWDSIKTAKWHAWSGLKDMSGNEAMRLFVKTLEEDEPNWYSYCTAGNEAHVEAVTTPVGNPGLRSMPSDDCWRTPWVVAEKPPHPRFEHSCCLIGSTMYVFGGNTAGGRYLPDVWQLNLETLAWTDITTAFQKVPTEPADEEEPANGDASPTSVSSSFPASAAGVAIPHRGRALLVGGHSKAQKADPTSTLTVRVLDPARHTWGVLPCTGDIPPARGGHAAALIGDKVYVFGGEGARLRLQTGVSVLDLMTNEWSELPVPSDPHNAPEPRSSLAATSYQDRYLILFGGGAVGKCHNDLWVLDTETGEWEQPAVTGPRPSARAGCSSALLGNRWYVLGGGNNATGCPDMWVLDLVKLGLDALEWKQVSEFEVRASLSSEGASLVAAPAYGALVAFGGYNGVFHNTVSVFKPAEVPENGVTGPPEIQPAGGEALEQGRSAHDAAPQEREAPAEAAPTSPPAHAGKNVAAMLEEVSIAREALQQELDMAQNALAAAEERAQTAQEELAAEKDRALKLEVELSDMQTKVQGMQELELECRKYKAMLAERERKGSGIWGYVTGA